MGDVHSEAVAATSSVSTREPSKPPANPGAGNSKSTPSEVPTKNRSKRRGPAYWRRNLQEIKLSEAIRKLQKKTLDVYAKLLIEQCILKSEAEHEQVEEIDKSMRSVSLKQRTPERKKNQIKAKKSPSVAASVPAVKQPKAEQHKAKSKTSTTESQLKNLYERHINQIVRGSNSDPNDPKWADLKFQIGDDLEIFAKKCVDAGLGYIVEGSLRVNAKNNHQAFLCLDGDVDPMISSLAARKYAMEGDTVRAFVRIRTDSVKEADATEDRGEVIEAIAEIEADPSDREDTVHLLSKAEAIEEPQRQSRKAFVISLVNEVGNRLCVGTIYFKNPVCFDNENYYKFKPRDMKVPMIYIPVESCNQFIAQGHSNGEKPLGYLYLAKITQIAEDGHCIGELKSLVGKCGDLKDEITAILVHNGLDGVKPFESRFEEMWSHTSVLTEEDIHGREDLRKECIFTIDPLTARDLDDAVSCKLLPNGNYQIGVHISDVTAYLDEKSELDELVKTRATSIYLVNEVIHMLPQSLCMKCSLLPDEDKLTFSVMWEITPAAEVLSTRFARTVIRSCTQLAYEHAQKIIDNPDELYTDDDLPTVCNGYNVEDIVNRVKILNSLAVIMRANRFDNGSLSIDKPHYYFQFEPVTGDPTGFEASTRLTANFLIEELMLLANQSVAAFIYKHFPSTSFLRRHEHPKTRVLRNLKTKLSTLGIDFDITSSQTIYEGLQRISAEAAEPDAMSAGLSHLLTKSMMRAKYYCGDMVAAPTYMYHYALAIPIYTHFTSPIRRYPDIIVHRLLSAALKYTPPPARTVNELHSLAHICNEQKWNARNASEDSMNLYFLRYVKFRKSIFIRAVVVEISKYNIEVLTVTTGHLLCVHFKQQSVVIDASKAPHAIYISESKNSTQPPVELRLFSTVTVRLIVYENRLHAFFVKPGSSGQHVGVKTTSTSQEQGTGKSVQTEKKKPRKRTKKKKSTNPREETGPTSAAGVDRTLSKDEATANEENPSVTSAEGNSEQTEKKKLRKRTKENKSTNPQEETGPTSAAGVERTLTKNEVIAIEDNPSVTSEEGNPEQTGKKKPRKRTKKNKSINPQEETGPTSAAGVDSTLNKDQVTANEDNPSVTSEEGNSEQTEKKKPRKRTKKNKSINPQEETGPTSAAGVDRTLNKDQVTANEDNPSVTSEEGNSEQTGKKNPRKRTKKNKSINPLEETGPTSAAGVERTLTKTEVTAIEDNPSVTSEEGNLEQKERTKNDESTNPLEETGPTSAAGVDRTLSKHEVIANEENPSVTSEEENSEQTGKKKPRKRTKKEKSTNPQEETGPTSAAGVERTLNKDQVTANEDNPSVTSEEGNSEQTEKKKPRKRTKKNKSINPLEETGPTSAAGDGCTLSKDEGTAIEDDLTVMSEVGNCEQTEEKKQEKRTNKKESTNPTEETRPASDAGDDRTLSKDEGTAIEDNLTVMSEVGNCEHTEEKKQEKRTNKKESTNPTEETRPASATGDDHTLSKDKGTAIEDDLTVMSEVGNCEQTEEKKQEKRTNKKESTNPTEETRPASATGDDHTLSKDKGTAIEDDLTVTSEVGNSKQTEEKKQEKRTNKKESTNPTEETRPASDAGDDRTLSKDEGTAIEDNLTVMSEVGNCEHTEEKKQEKRTNKKESTNPTEETRPASATGDDHTLSKDKGTAIEDDLTVMSEVGNCEQTEEKKQEKRTNKKESTNPTEETRPASATGDDHTLSKDKGTAIEDDLTVTSEVENSKQTEEKKQEKRTNKKESTNPTEETRPASDAGDDRTLSKDEGTAIEDNLTVMSEVGNCEHTEEKKQEKRTNKKESTNPTEETRPASDAGDDRTLSKDEGTAVEDDLTVTSEVGNSKQTEEKKQEKRTNKKESTNPTEETRPASAAGDDCTLSKDEGTAIEDDLTVMSEVGNCEQKKRTNEKDSTNLTEETRATSAASGDRPQMRI